MDGEEYYKITPKQLAYTLFKLSKENGPAETFIYVKGIQTGLGISELTIQLEAMFDPLSTYIDIEKVKNFIVRLFLNYINRDIDSIVEEVCTSLEKEEWAKIKEIIWNEVDI